MPTHGPVKLLGPGTEEQGGEEGGQTQLGTGERRGNSQEGLGLLNKICGCILSQSPTVCSLLCTT